jgi:hypothetical protein
MWYEKTAKKVVVKDKLRKTLNEEKVANSKHNYDAVVSFIKQTTCFGFCTEPKRVFCLIKDTTAP